ncbi:16S rRNA (cytosine1402-N4)-methyltransferase [Nakamurella panacisegetis]|uniref:Ribosomal RNA small subunit methyltransferase H n=1 Tax=Nakamurella panacisegetis TaxID=1090615 RepID=A0A1H0Q9T6_9ACTN|nr:16S rRNA (cytosine(1402)-N(4))-methyltransferase RsmH [Nakamurella panacisegetis]SDP13449.1 16S rRNA (cytosine1402-N4)-methyltransferase [Nakamurella panacisegetis]
MAPGSDPHDDHTAGQSHPEAEGSADRIHVPVLAARIVSLFLPAFATVPEPVFVDGTLGMGGHTLLMLAAVPQLRVIGIDRDPAALRIAGARIEAAGFGDRVELVHATNDQVGAVIRRRARDGVQGILFDLGVSSLQLDQVDRGFAYSVDAPLDMRMDPTTGVTAADVLNTYTAGDLARVLSRYGEEKFAKKIAFAIVRERAKEPFRTSARLVELLYAEIPAPARRTGGHPAKRTFQALRIEVNNELGVLTTAIPAAVDALAVGGRIVVMSFQSLEDRIVKHAIAPGTQSTAPIDLPVDLPGHEAKLRWLTRGSEKPTEEEINENPRAASARLRAAERVRKATP